MIIIIIFLLSLSSCSQQDKPLRYLYYGVSIIDKEFEDVDLTIFGIDSNNTNNIDSTINEEKRYSLTKINFTTNKINCDDRDIEFYKNIGWGYTDTTILNNIHNIATFYYDTISVKEVHSTKELIQLTLTEPSVSLAQGVPIKGVIKGGKKNASTSKPNRVGRRI